MTEKQKERISERGEERVLLIGVYAPYNKSGSPDDYYAEFMSLVETLGVPYHQTLFFRLRATVKAFFFTQGKLQEIIELCQEEGIKNIICSERLTPLQERNLEDMTNCVVWDREKLILEIFRRAAHTAEGKIQVEMAEIEFLKTRIAGKGVEFMQQAGFLGTRGPGETSKERIRRHFEEKIRQARKRLETLQKSRDVQRKQRLQSEIPLISVVGYTNAGKSSLVNCITKSAVLAENKLFATLDTTTHELFIDGKKKALISDTVGFISQLPHQLIEAFKSTLDELRYADLLLHVIDIGNNMWEHHIRVVNHTLRELGIAKPILHVFNKADKLSPLKRDMIADDLRQYHPWVMTSALSKEGAESLIDFLRSYDFKKAVPVQAIPSRPDEGL